MTEAAARGAELIRPATVSRIRSEADEPCMTIALPEKCIDLTARWLVDATGRGATPSLAFGAKRRPVDRLIGIARCFARESREPSTLVEAADDGWWYSAPRPGGRMVALFVTDGDSPAREAHKTEVWLRHLETAPFTRERLERAADWSSPRAYFAAPALLDWRLERPVLPVGDAAVSFDPISADGLCFALRSGIEAAAALLGVRGSARAYRDAIRNIFENHLARRALIYEKEGKIRPTPFWRRPRSFTARFAS